MTSCFQHFKIAGYSWQRGDGRVSLLILILTKKANIFHKMSNCSFSSVHAANTISVRHVLKCLHFYTDFHCLFSCWKRHWHWFLREFSSWTTGGPHTNREKSSIVIIGMNSVWPFAVVSGRGTQLDLVPGVLLAHDDSQFSYSVPHLALGILTQLAADHNICFVGVRFFLLLKGSNCWSGNLFVL